ncbi:MAG: thioredoxin family protein [Candidatus Nanohalobium sp.]
MEDVTVEVFYSETCPNCPPQKELVQKFSGDENVEVRLTDVAKNQDRAGEHNVRTVPTTVVNGPGIEGKTGFRGLMDEERLETAIRVAGGEEDPEALEKPGLVERLKELLG